MMIIATLALVAVGCSKSDDDDIGGNGGGNGNGNGGEGGNDDTTLVITPGTDERPAWEYPDYDKWEQTMSVKILMQNELEPYMTQNDLLCATMNDEVRGLTPPTIEDEYDSRFFPLTIGADGAEARIFLHYYCDSLHRIFTIDWSGFDANAIPMGDDPYFYRPTFLK